eukprot:CAMPEP_0119265202 /NCGR_PEP_ID=MMETSP1329-20130426/4076_1 /TAXON_ID=114041 /ORGANISM="Genus nov. species nov., Strain RCC1024" /LENGTH=288 /DNA_ID=CAMNT_0007265013 /DNA_START=147 /DNA_END=1009 /DNA_ORIENTATION=-
MTTTTQLIKQLRAATGSKLMDCKAAVEATSSLEEALEWLRKKGMSRAAKLSARVAEHGLVAARAGGGAGVLLEVNSETDFVARNAEFQKFVADLAASALEHRGTLETTPDAARGSSLVAGDALLGLPLADGVLCGDAATQLSAHVGERVVVRRAGLVSGDVVGAYVHLTDAKLNPGAGLAAAIVAVTAPGAAAEAAALDDVVKKAAMHCVAARPAALSVDTLPAGALAAERAVLEEQVPAGKPPEIVEKILAGRLKKFAEEQCFASQAHVVEGGKDSVAKVLKPAELA